VPKSGHGQNHQYWLERKTRHPPGLDGGICEHRPAPAVAAGNAVGSSGSGETAAHRSPARRGTFLSVDGSGVTQREPEHHGSDSHDPRSHVSRPLWRSKWWLCWQSSQFSCLRCHFGCSPVCSGDLPLCWSNQGASISQMDHAPDELKILHLREPRSPWQVGGGHPAVHRRVAGCNIGGVDRYQPASCVGEVPHSGAAITLPDASTSPANAPPSTVGT